MSTWPEGGRGRQCWHAGLDSADARRDDQDPLFLQAKKPRNRCWKGSSNGRLQVRPPRSTGS